MSTRKSTIKKVEKTINVFTLKGKTTKLVTSLDESNKLHFYNLEEVNGDLVLKHFKTESFAVKKKEENESDENFEKRKREMMEKALECEKLVTDAALAFAQ